MHEAAQEVPLLARKEKGKEKKKKNEEEGRKKGE